MARSKKAFLTPSAQAKKVIARNTLYDDAVAWCKANKKGTTTCVQQQQFSSLSERSLRRLLNAKPKPKTHHLRVLTDAEEVALAKWLDEANKCFNGKTREEITAQVCVLLKRRKALRRSSKQR